MEWNGERSGQTENHLTLYNNKGIDVSSPRTADRGPSRVEGSRGFVTTNQGPDSGPAGQWEEREQGRLPDATPPQEES